ncbi:hypothetical protein RUM43_010748 [Polyplax serrata]|uniref:Uncharacterized protein n=1 Tax=Polyplax serrata TaxID=468196 RepID=A0AAN8S515_POLSC
MAGNPTRLEKRHDRSEDIRLSKVRCKNELSLAVEMTGHNDWHDKAVQFQIPQTDGKNCKRRLTGVCHLDDRKNPLDDERKP